MAATKWLSAMSSLNEREVMQLQLLIGLNNVIIMAARATIFSNSSSASGSQKEFKCDGIFTFARDSERRGNYLVLYGLQNYTKLWETKLTTSLCYSKVDEKQHTIKTATGSLAIVFETEYDGKTFGDEVIQAQERHRSHLNEIKDARPNEPPPSPPGTHNVTKNSSFPDGDYSTADSVPAEDNTMDGGNYCLLNAGWRVDEKVYPTMSMLIKDRLAQRCITSVGRETSHLKDEDVKIRKKKELINKVPPAISSASSQRPVHESNSAARQKVRDNRKLRVSSGGPPQKTRQEVRPVALPFTTVYHGKMCEVGDIAVVLEAGDISQSKADVIVNSIGKECVFQNGGVAQALSMKAGLGLEIECKAVSPLKLKAVVRTGGYRLDCKEVFHCCCPPNYDPEAVREIFEKCLNMASKSQYATMVIPVFGTGNLGYPFEDVIKVKMETLALFTLKQPSSSLKAITMMIYYKDELHLKTMRRLVNEQRKIKSKSEGSAGTNLAHTPSQSTPNLMAAQLLGLRMSSDNTYETVAAPLRLPTNPYTAGQPKSRVTDPVDGKGSAASTLNRPSSQSNYDVVVETCESGCSSDGYEQPVETRKEMPSFIKKLPNSLPPELDTVKNVVVQLKERDISDIVADVIVSTASENLDLQTGEVSRALSKKAGPNLQKECSTKAPLSIGQVVKTKGYKLKCKTVFHCCCPAKYSAKALQSIIMDCLRMATEKKYTTMAMPLFGTGSARYPVDDVLQVILDALSRFLEMQQCTVKTLAVIVKEKDATTIEKVCAFAARKKFGEPKDVPSTWTEPVEKLQHVPLEEGRKERQQLEAQFKATFHKWCNVEIVQVFRIQNLVEYKHYDLEKQKVAAARQIKVERDLWHGTAADAATKISSGFFDRGFAGKNATAFGKGCYFSSTTSYSDQYAIKSDDGSQYMLRAKVITGYYCKGDQSMNQAPLIAGSATERYDSVVNDENDPTIFVVFRDAAAYPEYMIKYKV